MFLDNDGIVYITNSPNTNGKSWFNHAIPYSIIDLAQVGSSLLIHNKIVNIETGSDFSLFLDKNGKVYSCFYGYYTNYGQLWRSGNNYAALQITDLDSYVIVGIAAGNFHSLFLDNTGNVYSCGYNDEGRLGRTTTSSSDEIPTEIDQL